MLSIFDPPPPDIEVGGEEPPRGLWKKQTCLLLVLLGLLGSVAVAYRNYEAFLDNRTTMTAQHIKFSGDSRFKVTDAGHHDKMQLRLRVRHGKTYRLVERSRRIISRTIKVPATGQNMISQPKEQLLTIGLRFQTKDKADELGSDAEPEEEQDVVRLLFQCDKFSILNRNQPHPEIDHLTQQQGLQSSHKWQAPKVWQAMADSVKHKKFLVRLATNGSVVSMGTQPLHQAVIQSLHNHSALPLEMSYKLELLPETTDDEHAGPPPMIDALGAQWNSPGTKTVYGELVLVNLSLCSPHPDLKGSLPGRIAVVARGGCKFADKAVLAEAYGAVGLVVVNDPGAELLLMSAPHPRTQKVPAIMISAESAARVKIALAQNPHLQAAILAGADAVVAHVQNQDSKDLNFRLPDFMGYDSMIEEEVNRFFSIFPGEAVGIGDSWERTIHVLEQDQRAAQVIRETFTLLDMPGVPAECKKHFGSGYGACGNARPGVARISVQSRSDATSSGAGGALGGLGAVQGKTKIREVGELLVDTATGIIKSGHLNQTLEGTSPFPQFGPDATLQTNLKAFATFEGAAGDPDPKE